MVNAFHTIKLFVTYNRQSSHYHFRFSTSSVFPKSSLFLIIPGLDIFHVPNVIPRKLHDNIFVLDIIPVFDITSVPGIVSYI